MKPSSVDVSIDPKLLPARALVDTGLVIRAVGDRPRDPNTPAATAFWEAMIQNRKEIVVAAPTVSEMLREKRKTPVPRVMGVEVVPFDTRAAEILGDRFPETTLIRARDATKTPIHYIKYDALIIACGIRWAAPVLVGCDEPMLRAARALGIEAKHPKEYIARQGSLPFQAPPAGSKETGKNKPESR